LLKDGLVYFYIHFFFAPPSLHFPRLQPPTASSFCELPKIAVKAPTLSEPPMPESPSHASRQTNLSPNLDGRLSMRSSPEGCLLFLSPVIPLHSSYISSKVAKDFRTSSPPPEPVPPRCSLPFVLLDFSFVSSREPVKNRPASFPDFSTLKFYHAMPFQTNFLQTRTIPPMSSLIIEFFPSYPPP